jgi:inhibitor of cysteine peptidase
MIFAASLALAMQSVMLDEASNGKTIALNRGDKLVISLPSNPSTGYVWELASDGAPATHRAGEPSFHPANPQADALPKPGAPGRQLFEFVAASSGAGNIEIHYIRPWEKNAAPARSYSVKADVR